MLLDLEEPGEIILGEHTAATGTIVRIPDQIEYNEGEIPIAIGGWFVPDTNFYWHMSGTMNVINSHPQNFQLKISGKMFITMEGNGPMPPIESVAGIGYTLVRHFGQQGDQEVHNNFYVSDTFSPTGFPIFTGESPWSSISGNIPIDDLEQISEKIYKSEFEFILSNDESLPIQSGYYGLLFMAGLMNKR